MEFQYTQHQVARGARPDTTDGGASLFLFKYVSRLRLTYQIRLLTFMAEQSGARVVIRVPKMCKISPPLREFLKANKKFAKIERVA